MKRKRGAPLGNLNAFKHGFYSGRFSPAERRSLDEQASPDLVDEIALVRVAVSRFLASLEMDDAPRDLQSELAILRTINLGALSINGLVRTRLMLAASGTSLNAAVSFLRSSSTPAPDPSEPASEEDSAD
jgi:hypothetical protein